MNESTKKLYGEIFREKKYIFRISKFLCSYRVERQKNKVRIFVDFFDKNFFHVFHNIIKLVPFI
jgi:hypothetical protein